MKMGQHDLLALKLLKRFTVTRKALRPRGANHFTYKAPSWSTRIAHTEICNGADSNATYKVHRYPPHQALLPRGSLPTTELRSQARTSTLWMEPRRLRVISFCDLIHIGP